jgi:PAS domain S-box-containing protein/putative nucleotidyltransferase with HDIG domain
VDLRVLFVEDSADDVELMLRRLRAAGIVPDWARVDTGAALREALADESWQLALVDYNLPGFNGRDALTLLAEHAPDVPAITVSGAIDEDTAVATLTAGAVDYVLKDNLTRLAPAVLRAVEGANLRRHERRAAEQARETMHAIEHSSQGIAYVMQDGSIRYANAAAYDLAGISREAVDDRRVWGWSPEVDERRWAEIWREARDGPVHSEIVIRRADGEERLITATIDYQARTDDSFVTVYARDITEERETEARAAQTETLYRRIVEMSSEGIWVFDCDDRVTFANRQMERILGHEPDGMVGLKDLDFMFEEDAADHETERARRRQGVPGEYVRRFRTRDGDAVWLAVSAVADVGADGVYAGTFAICTDVTERRRTEEALRESEDRFEQFAERFPGYLFMQDEECRYVYVNRRGQDDGGVLRDAWLGKAPLEIWEGPDATRSEEEVRSALRGEVIDIVEPWAPSGLNEHLHSVYFPIPREGKPPLVGGLSIDVTEQVEAQEEVRRQAEQLRRIVEGAVLAMSNVVETRDPYTAGHERRVAELAAAIAAALGMEGEELNGLRLAALIHDIGKIAVPAEILAKPGKLSVVEFNLIKQHPMAGCDILGVIEFERPVATIVRQHHERLDGSGYPEGLVGEDTLPEARILAVADVVEAMSSHRPYRPALGMEAALAEIRAQSGILYDATVVDACVRLVQEEGFAFTG